MNFLNLKYFLVLAEELNFTQSAEKLHISQQSLSAHIIRLEKEFGVQLFDREPPLHLTAAGEEFAKSARVILKEKDSLSKKLEGILNFQQSSITIGVPISRSAILMPRVLSAFHQEYPLVKIQIVEGSSSEILRNLHKGDTDMIFGFRPEDTTHLEVENICVETTKIVVPNSILDRMPERDELLNSQTPLPLSTFMQCPFVALNQSTLTGNMLNMIAAEENFVPNIIMESKNLMTMLAMCCAGIGVCICPNSFLINTNSLINTTLLQQVTIFNMRSDYEKSHIVVARLKDKYQSVPEKRLVQIIKNTYKKDAL